MCSGLPTMNPREEACDPGDEDSGVMDRMGILGGRILHSWSPSAGLFFAEKLSRAAGVPVLLEQAG